MPRRSLIEYLDTFYVHGSETATVHRRGYRTVRWSYRRVAETACQFARELEERKVGKGDRILIWGENCAEWVAAFWGCLLRGAVVVPMDHIASSDFALRVCRQVDARLAVRSREHTQLDPALPVIILETLSDTLSRQDHSPYPAPPLAREDTAEIIFTSGTTADPKGVILSHGNILANLEPLEQEIDKYLKYERLVHPLRFLNLLPLSHIFGQFLGLFVPSLLAATVIFQDTLNPSEIVRTVKRERVSVLVTVPRLLEALKDKIERDLELDRKLDAFRQQFDAAKEERFFRRWWRFRAIHNTFGWKFWAFICGGAALYPSIETFWSRLGFVVIQGYGLTETTSVISINHPFRPSKGSIGQVLPGREIKLDKSGEILVRGESIASGYWQGSEVHAVPSEEGWFHTGDLGELGENGALYFKGRGKNVIVTSDGMNIYPDDLEAALRRQPEVRDCVVLGIERGGREVPCAVLILRSGPENEGGDGENAHTSRNVVNPSERNPESIVQRANESLAEYQRINCWFVWPAPDFPRTSTQKPRLNLILEMVQAQSNNASGPGAPAVTAGGESVLANLIRGITGHASGALSPDAKLETDLHLSSIDRVELLGAIEDRYQIDVNENRFAAATTVAQLEQMLRQRLPQRSDYKYPRWAQRWPVTWIRLAVYYLLVWPATVLLAYPRIHGRENLKGLKGPVLVISNHITSIDIGFLLIALPARFRQRLATAMMGERLRGMRHPSPEFNWLHRWIQKLGYALVVALFNVFPLPQESGFRESFQFAGESVDRGFSVLVFPEGERSKDGRIAPFRAGIGVLANKLNIPIVPVRIDGLFELKKAGKKMASPGTVKVTIGSPVRFDPETDPSFIARELEAKVESLGRPTI